MFQVFSEVFYECLKCYLVMLWKVSNGAFLVLFSVELLRIKLNLNIAIDVFQMDLQNNRTSNTYVYTFV